MPVIIRREIDVCAVVRIDVEVQQAAFADTLFTDTRAHSNNTTDNIGPLNAREGERRFAAHLERRHFPFFSGV